MTKTRKRTNTIKLTKLRFRPVQNGYLALEHVARFSLKGINYELSYGIPADNFHKVSMFLSGKKNGETAPSVFASTENEEEWAIFDELFSRKQWESFVDRKKADLLEKLESMVPH